MMAEILKYIPLAFAAGFLLNFMPCVLPVIPIKVRMLTAKDEVHHKTRLSRALTMSAGTLFFFVFLALVMQLFNLTWGGLFYLKTVNDGFFTYSGITLLMSILVIIGIIKLQKETDLRERKLYSAFILFAIILIIPFSGSGGLKGLEPYSEKSHTSGFYGKITRDAGVYGGVVY